MMTGWTFAPNGDGEEYGFHNAGVETFKGTFEHYLAREAIQNSVDARANLKKPVVVSFDLIELGREDIPGMDDLSETLGRCAKYCNKDKKAKAFFERGQKIARSGAIPCLQIGDSNTSGVSGSDSDREGGWYNLVRSSGASAKGGGEGGSFGLGKHAPFAASRMRTVFYSTRTVEDTFAFQGVARLVTHDSSEGKKQPTGFFGEAGGRSIRNKQQIARWFKREEPGTDVYVLGYQPPIDWETQIAFSVLTCFWPAIHRNDLNVRIGEMIISAKTLPKMLEEYGSNHKGFDAHLYYHAYTDAAAQETVTPLPTLGEVTVRLLAGDQNYPNHVAMVRKTGMIIYFRRSRSTASFCGVFECRNNIGNQLLRDMEPPRHDAWDGNLPEPGDNTKPKKELDDHVIDCIRKLTPQSTEKVIIIPDLSQYLPDDGETPEDSIDGPTSDKENGAESLESTPKKQQIAGRVIARKPPTQPGGAKEGDGEIGAEGDGSGDKGGKPNEGDGGDKGSTGSGQDGSGIPGGDSGRTPVTVRGRSFIQNAAQGIYILTIQPPMDRPKGEVYLSIAAVGDDAQPVPVSIKSARLANKQKLVIHQNGRIGPVSFPKTATLRIEVTLAEPRRLSLDVSAFEVMADETE